MLDDMRPQDEAQIYELMTQLKGDPLPYAQFERVFAAYLADESVRCIVAREDENVLGFASVHTRMLMHHASPVSELQELVVAESCRGRGIAARCWRRPSGKPSVGKVRSWSCAAI